MLYISSITKNSPFLKANTRTVLGTKDKKGGGRCHHLRFKRRHFLAPFLSNEPGAV
jgi:hypothetical protein